jgi:histidinol-phosphate/aromatic aminotransferase/cobyric acid decarboxylase-like protein
LFPVVVLRTASFAYGMAGLRCGYAIARRDIASVMDGSLLYYLNSALNSDAIAEIIPGRKGWKHPEGNLNRLAEAGFISSLVNGQEHIEFVRKQNRKSMKLTCDKLDEIGVKYIPSQASFILIQTDETLMSLNETMTEENPPQSPFDKGGSRRQGDFGKVVSNGIDGKTAALKLAQWNIIVRDGNDFSWRYKNFIRVSIGTQDEMMAFVSALKEILK